MDNHLLHSKDGSPKGDLSLNRHAKAAFNSSLQIEETHDEDDQTNQTLSFFNSPKSSQGKRKKQMSPKQETREVINEKKIVEDMIKSQPLVSKMLS